MVGEFSEDEEQAAADEKNLAKQLESNSDDGLLDQDEEVDPSTINIEFLSMFRLLCMVKDNEALCCYHHFSHEKR